MPNVADWRSPSGPGVFPMRHRGFDTNNPPFDVNGRAGMAGFEILDRDDNATPNSIGHWKEDQDTRGDLNVANYWQSDYTQRGTGCWAWGGFGCIVSKSSAGSSTPSGNRPSVPSVSPGGSSVVAGRNAPTSPGSTQVMQKPTAMEVMPIGQGGQMDTRFKAKTPMTLQPEGQAMGDPNSPTNSPNGLGTVTTPGSNISPGNTTATGAISISLAPPPPPIIFGGGASAGGGSLGGGFDTQTGQWSNGVIMGTGPGGSLGPGQIGGSELGNTGGIGGGLGGSTGPQGLPGPAGASGGGGGVGGGIGGGGAAGGAAGSGGGSGGGGSGGGGVSSIGSGIFTFNGNGSTAALTGEAGTGFNTGFYQWSGVGNLVGGQGGFVGYTGIGNYYGYGFAQVQGIGNFYQYGFVSFQDPVPALQIQIGDFGVAY